MPRAAHPTIRLILRSAHASACARLEGWAARPVPLMLRDADRSQACAGCVNLPALRLLSMRARESSRGLRTRGELHPTPLPHAAMAGFGEGHVADTGSEIARERRAGCDMTQERLPSDTVGVAVVR